MAKKPEKNLVVALDVGTSKIACLVAEVGPDDALQVIGLGMAPSTGLKKGMVINIEATTRSIRRAVEEAELMAACRIHSVHVGISGSHIKSLNSAGMCAVRGSEVTHSDVERVIDNACAVAIPADQKILHVLPQVFKLDDHEGIQEPIGMSGVRLEAKVHVVTGAVSAAQNITKCVQGCGLQISRLTLEQLASSHAVLTEDERQLGICLVDIGAGTSDIAVFRNGSIRHTAVIPVAGDQVTNDIAIVLRTPAPHADALKLNMGHALPELVDPNEMIEVPSVGAHPARRLARHSLAEVIKARYEDLFQLIQKDLIRSGFDESITGGLVLTGGGSKLPGLVELAEEVLHVPVRIGAPHDVQGMNDVINNPIHATGVGLLQFGHQSQRRVHRDRDESDGFGAMLQRMKGWFQGNF